MSEGNWSSKASSEVIIERALMSKNIRAFFDARDVIEVETPLLSQFATTDPHLDSFQSCFREQPCFLNTSPEYAMKRLLSTLHKPIYQIGKAFRDDELGANHNPEFTMLEWYQPAYDDEQLMDEMEALIQTIAKQSSNKCLLASESSCSGNSGLRFKRLSYQQAFELAAGINPHTTTVAECYQVAIDNKVSIPQGLTLAEEELNDWLDWLLTQLILPSFNNEGFVFIYDYPVSQCALAKIALNQQQIPVAKRFELFFDEVELANGFYELTDAETQLARFEADNLRRVAIGKAPVRIDENFIAALNHGLPECSGVALGLDRLLMVLCGFSDIRQVLSFSWHES